MTPASPTPFPGASAQMVLVLVLVFLAALALTIAVPLLLRYLPQRVNLLVGAALVAGLLTLTIVTDLLAPEYEPAWLTWWSEHALFAGSLTSFLLLGVGYVAYQGIQQQEEDRLVDEVIESMLNCKGALVQARSLPLALGLPKVAASLPPRQEQPVERDPLVMQIRALPAAEAFQGVDLSRWNDAAARALITTASDMVGLLRSGAKAYRALDEHLLPLRLSDSSLLRSLTAPVRAVLKTDFGLVWPEQWLRVEMQACERLLSDTGVESSRTVQELNRLLFRILNESVLLEQKTEVCAQHIAEGVELTARGWSALTRDLRTAWRRNRVPARMRPGRDPETEEFYAMFGQTPGYQSLLDKI